MYVSGIGALPAWDVGHLVCREHGRDVCAECAALPVVKGQPLPLRRDVQAGDVAALVADIVAAVRAHGVEHLAIEEAQGNGPESVWMRWIAGECAAALSGVAAVEMVALPRESRTHDMAARAKALLAAGGDVGADVAQEGGDDASAWDREIRGQGSGEGVRPPRGGDVDAVPGDVGAEADPRSQGASPLLSAPHVGGTSGDAEVRGRDPLLAGPRVAGIDPGSHWIAVTVAAVTPSGLAYVAHLVIEVGRVEVLPTPRTITREDGSTYRIKRKRVIEDEDTVNAVAKVVAFLRAHGVERACVERATFFRKKKRASPATIAATAAQLLRAQWIGGEIAATLRAGMVPSVTSVESASSKSWRVVVCKAAKVPAKGDAWKGAVRVAMAGLPAVVNEHAIDAAGLAAWLTRPPVTKRVRSERGKRAPMSAEAKERHRVAARDHARRKAGTDRRAEAGCTCTGKHKRECPLFVSMADRRAAKAAAQKEQAA